MKTAAFCRAHRRTRPVGLPLLGRLLALGLLGTATACSAILPDAPPAAQYRLSPSQLDWQPYHVGQLLRFGNARTATVRTYVVSGVSDRLETAYCSVCLGQQPKYQSVTVTVQRTDTASTAFAVLDMALHRDRTSGSDAPVLYATGGWLYYGTPSLPLNELNSGSVLDTVQYRNLALLPTATLGATSYQQVLRYRNKGAGQPSPGVRAIQAMYFVKSQGIVAFEEKASGLWYRLP